MYPMEGRGRTIYGLSDLFINLDTKHKLATSTAKKIIPCHYLGCSALIEVPFDFNEYDIVYCQPHLDKINSVMGQINTQKLVRQAAERIRGLT